METTGIEPVTPCMSSKYSNQLSYASVWNGTIITRSAQFVNSLVKICDLIVIFSRGGADFAEHVSIVLQKLRRQGSVTVFLSVLPSAKQYIIREKGRTVSGRAEVSVSKFVTDADITG